MTRLVVVALAAGFAALLTAPTAQAQTAPTSPASARPGQPATQAEAARAQRQQQMTPEEADRDRQLQLMEARTGSNSFGMDRSSSATSVAGQQTGGFRLRKFKALPGQEEEKGTTRRVLMGARTTGKPLVHNKQKHRFLFF